VTGTEDRVCSVLGRRQPEHVKGDLVDRPVLGLRRQPDEIKLAEADEGIVEDLGPAGMPALTGHVLLGLHAPGHGDEMVVDDPEDPSLTGWVLPFGQVQLEEGARVFAVHRHDQIRQEVVERLGTGYQLGLVLDDAE
jgi:hypothetical protein